MGFQYRVEIDLVLPNWTDASVPLQQCAEEIKNDSQRNIRLGTDFETGAPFESLSKKTVQDKLREVGFGDRPLFRKGIMFNAIHAYKATRDEVTIGIVAKGKPTRDKVAIWQQIEGVNQHTKTIRRFFGVSDKRLKWITSRMVRWVKEQTEKAQHKHISI